MKHRLKALRQDSGKSAFQVGVVTGVNPQTIYDLESGKNTNPTIDTLQKLADFYGIKVGDLLDEGNQQ